MLATGQMFSPVWLSGQRNTREPLICSSSVPQPCQHFDVLHSSISTTGASNPVDLRSALRGHGPRLPCPKVALPKKKHAAFLLVLPRFLLAPHSAPFDALLHSICLAAAPLRYRSYVLLRHEFAAVDRSRSFPEIVLRRTLVRRTGNITSASHLGRETP